MPGPAGGEALARVIFGSVNPSGRLPFDWPRRQDGGGSFDRLVTEKCTRSQREVETLPFAASDNLPNYTYEDCEVEWTFGTGLSFTTFEHSLAAPSTATIGSGTGHDKVTIAVTTTNTGSARGKTAVLGFSFIETRRSTPPTKELFDFVKTVELDPGESTVNELTLRADHLTFLYDDAEHFVLQDGMRVRLGVGEKETDCVDGGCSEVIVVDKGERDERCEEACAIWDEACPEAFGGGGGGGGEEAPTSSAAETCLEFCKMSKEWSWNYVSCLEGSWYFSPPADEGRMCFELIDECRDIFAANSAGSKGITYLENVLRVCGGEGKGSGESCHFESVGAVNVTAFVLLGLMLGVIGCFFWGKRSGEEGGEASFSLLAAALRASRRGGGRRGEGGGYKVANDGNDEFVIGDGSDDGEEEGKGGGVQRGGDVKGEMGLQMGNIENGKM